MSDRVCPGCGHRHAAGKQCTAAVAGAGVGQINMCECEDETPVKPAVDPASPRGVCLRCMHRHMGYGALSCGAPLGTMGPMGWNRCMCEEKSGASIGLEGNIELAYMSDLDLEADIAGHVRELEPDARRVVAFVARRMKLGQVHGVLDLVTDKRTWEKELGEELGDVLSYVAMKALSTLLKR